MHIQADLALYESKAAGQGPMVLFEQEMDQEYKRQGMKAAIARRHPDGVNDLFYQPMFNPEGTRIAGRRSAVAVEPS
jgi:predicted signal transduction protein with EAL and GGDEF domain